MRESPQIASPQAERMSDDQVFLICMSFNGGCSGKLWA